MSFHKWLQRREYGFPPRRGDGDFIMKRVYSSIEPYQHWNDLLVKPDKTSEFGAIFNLEFSPEGKILVAACEKKSILLFDAITTKQNHKVTDAHTDNVNCIKFLDDRLFATCSDDTTVALWDLRYLKMKVRSLHGHSNWVKNVEYSHKDNLLVTSGFDGSIFTWDINSHTEHGLIYQKVFHTSGLMRCCIAPDGTKLVICTTGGYLMVIHNLDLTSLHKDLCGFRPSIYRLMQMGHQYIPQAAKFDHVFSQKQKRNRVELITDFPDEDDAEVILALQVHPMGHAILSRNINYDELSEWSCVHDINGEPDDVTENVHKDSSGKRKRKLENDSDDENQRRELIEEESRDSTDDIQFSVNRRHRNLYTRRGTPPLLPGIGTSSRASGSVNIAAAPINRSETFVPDIWAAEVTVQERAIRQNRARSSNSVTGYSFVYAISSGVLPAAAAATTATATASRPQSTIANPFGSTANSRRNASVGTLAYEGSRYVRPGSPYPNVSTTDGGSSSSTSSSDSSPLFPLESLHVRSLSSPLRSKEHKIFQNPKKLMYYIQESNKGKGFIKEPSFSADGRIISSPYNTGVRLLAFSAGCSEYPRHHRTYDCCTPNPKPLAHIKNITSHSDFVLCSKFSPREPLLVTGCRSGKIVWYHPNL